VRIYSFLGQASAEGEGELATSSHESTSDMERTIQIFATIAGSRAGDELAKKYPYIAPRGRFIIGVLLSEGLPAGFAAPPCNACGQARSSSVE